MPCDQCADALAKGQKFCGSCGAATEALSVEALNKQVVDLSARISELIAARNSAEQRFLEVDTAQKVVDRLMSWAKLFGFFVGIPTAIILIGLGIWAGKSIKDFHDLASAGQASVNASLERARGEAKAAETQAATALGAAHDVNNTIQATQEKLGTLSINVLQSVDKVGKLNSGVDQQQARLATLTAATTAQTKAVNTLNQKVEQLKTSRIEQQVSDAHPEYGARFVIDRTGERLTKETKESGKTYVYIDLLSESPAQPKVSQHSFSIGVEKLSNNGFHTLIGQVALAAGSSSNMSMLGGFGTSLCVQIQVTTVTAGQGAPCIAYFKESGRGKALEAQRLLADTEKIPDDRVRLMPTATLPPVLKEIVERSDLDMAIIIGP